MDVLFEGDAGEKLKTSETKCGRGDVKKCMVTSSDVCMHWHKSHGSSNGSESSAQALLLTVASSNIFRDVFYLAGLVCCGVLALGSS